MFWEKIEQFVKAHPDDFTIYPSGKRKIVSSLHRNPATKRLPNVTFEPETCQKSHSTVTKPYLDQLIDVFGITLHDLDPDQFGPDDDTSSTGPHAKP